jgi:Ser-tRNA(Ala) deacylase AlaX
LDQLLRRLHVGIVTQLDRVVLAMAVVRARTVRHAQRMENSASWLTETVRRLKTRKLYYEDPLLGACSAVVESVSDKGVRLNQTVAFPEGGGQKGDRGVLVLPSGEHIGFTDTQKGPGRQFFRDDFPVIHVDTPVYHCVAAEHLSKLKKGDEVRVGLDLERRARLTVSHTASHLLFLGVGAIMPEVTAQVKGCSISEDHARFDFATTATITLEHLGQIEAVANDYVRRCLAVSLYPHPEELEAWYWKCDGKVIPCGGTHTKTTGSIGPLFVRRKSLGKRGERLTVTFPAAAIDTSVYRDWCQGSVHT